MCPVLPKELHPVPDPPEQPPSSTNLKQDSCVILNVFDLKRGQGAWENTSGVQQIAKHVIIAPLTFEIKIDKNYNITDFQENQSF